MADYAHRIHGLMPPDGHAPSVHLNPVRPSAQLNIGTQFLEWLNSRDACENLFEGQLRTRLTRRLALMTRLDIVFPEPLPPLTYEPYTHVVSGYASAIYGRPQQMRFMCIDLDLIRVGRNPNYLMQVFDRGYQSLGMYFIKCPPFYVARFRIDQLIEFTYGDLLPMMHEDHQEYTHQHANLRYRAGYCVLRVEKLKKNLEIGLKACIDVVKAPFTRKPQSSKRVSAGPEQITVEVVPVSKSPKRRSSVLDEIDSEDEDITPSSDVSATQRIIIFQIEPLIATPIVQHDFADQVSFTAQDGIKYRACAQIIAGTGELTAEISIDRAEITTENA